MFQGRCVEAKGEGRASDANASEWLCSVKQGKLSQAALDSVLRLESSFFPYVSGSQVWLRIRITHRLVKRDCWAPPPVLLLQVHGEPKFPPDAAATQGPALGTPAALWQQTRGCYQALLSTLHSTFQQVHSWVSPGGGGCTPSIPC